MEILGLQFHHTCIFPGTHSCEGQDYLNKYPPGHVLCVNVEKIYSKNVSFDSFTECYILNGLDLHSSLLLQALFTTSFIYPMSHTCVCVCVCLVWLFVCFFNSPKHTHRHSDSKGCIWG